MAIPKDRVAAYILLEDLRTLRGHPGMKHDISATLLCFCSPQMFALLRDAPRPVPPAAA